MKRHSFLHDSRSRCFTLIELLVVIAIIAILASMLLPSLASVREKGRKAVCTGNLKQIGTAIQMYIDDNTFWTPDCNGFANSLLDSAGNYLWYDTYWTAMICPYLGAPEIAPATTGARISCMRMLTSVPGPPASPMALSIPGFCLYPFTFCGSGPEICIKSGQR